VLAAATSAHARDVVGRGDVQLAWSGAAGGASAYVVFVSRDGGPYRSEQYTSEPRARVAGRAGETVRVLVRAYGVANGRTLASAPSEPSEAIRFLAAEPAAAAVGAPPPSVAPITAALAPALAPPSSSGASFAPPLRIQAGGDFDGDGDVDLLATLGSWSHPLALFLEAGSLAQLSCLAPLESASSAFAADFDGDGRDELALRGADGLSLLRLDRAGAPVLIRREALPPGARALAADLDGDSVASLVVYDPETGRLGERGGKSADFGAIRPLFGLLAGDFDGDGRDDLVIQPRAGGEGELWLMREGGSFAVAPLRVDGQVAAPAAIDWNGDGRDDLAGYDAVRGELRAWLLDGGGRVVERRALGKGPVEALRVLDLDGDGRKDLLVSAPSGAASALLSAP
jgi:hypothetical protein